MLFYREYIEDILRFSSWYLDYYSFLITSIFRRKKIGDVKSIIIIDLKYIGDLIIDTPMIRALKDRYPNAKISILVPQPMREVLMGNPDIFSIITDDKASLERFSHEKIYFGIFL